MLTINEIRKTVEKIGKKYGIKSAYLFGSYAKGTAREGSDVDIMIDMSSMRKYRDYFYFCEELKRELGTDVDVTAEEGLLPAFYDSIMGSRMVLYGV